MSKIFDDFYGKQDTLEVCLILFDKCNLHCKFCFENHTHIISTQEVIEVGDKLIPQLEDVIIKRPYLKKFVLEYILSSFILVPRSISPLHFNGGLYVSDF